MASRQERAIWHPQRVPILELIIRGPRPLSQIASAVGQPPEKVAYHSSVLCAAGCIQPAGDADADPRDPLFEARA